MRSALVAAAAACIGLGWASARADDPAIRHRTCGQVITANQPLCDPGEADIVAKPFDLYAKAKQVAVDPALSDLPSRLTAYVYGFTADPDEGWLAPPVFHVPQAFPEHRASLGTIRFHLHNMLPRLLDNTDMINNSIPAGDQPINIHTHGLVVLPHRADRDGAYGDFVGVLGCPATTTASCPHDPMSAAMTEVCGMAKSEADGHPCPDSEAGDMARMDHSGPAGVHHIHGHDLLLTPVPYAIDVPGTHPASYDWFHPHAHEISSPQVGAGLSGVLTIGSLCSDPALAPNSRAELCAVAGGESVLNDKVRVRVLMLKDLQVFKDRQGGDGTGTQASAEGYRVIPACDVPGLVTSGYCAFSADPADQPPATLIGGHWLFTINGQLRPTVTLQDGVPEIWRVANVSSNATYRLSLCFDPPQADGDLVTCANRKPFQILSLDGGRTPGTTDLAGETEVLLPPGARAELLISPKAGETYQLVQKGFKQPDLYPPVVMASVETVAGAGTAPSVRFVAAEPPIAGPPAMQLDEPEDCEHRPDALGVNDWVSLKGADADVSVFFGRISSDPEILSLGLIKGDVANATDPTLRQALATCLSGGDPDSFACRTFKGGAFTMEHRNLCLKHGAKVRFHLYNFTAETHNFHIHQQKFNVGGAPAALTTDASTAATLGSLIQRKAAAGHAGTSLAAGDPAPIVDSVPVPSIWFTDASGNVPAQLTRDDRDEFRSPRTGR